MEKKLREKLIEFFKVQSDFLGIGQFFRINLKYACQNKLRWDISVSFAQKIEGYNTICLQSREKK